MCWKNKMKGENSGVYGAECSKLVKQGRPFPPLNSSNISEAVLSGLKK